MAATGTRETRRTSAAFAERAEQAAERSEEAATRVEQAAERVSEVISGAAAPVDGHAAPFVTAPALDVSPAVTRSTTN